MTATLDFVAPPVSINDFVMMADDPNAPDGDWSPALVTGTGENGRIVGQLFHKVGAIVLIEGSRHKDDPVWDDPERVRLFSEEDIKAWRHGGAVYDLQKRVEELERQLASAGGIVPAAPEQPVASNESLIQEIDLLRKQVGELAANRMPQPTKRGRGRPRKHPVDATA